MNRIKKWLRFTCLFFLGILLFYNHGNTQRVYAPNSVLAAGKWVKVGTTANGIYKIDAAALRNWGFGETINSTAVKIYSNGGGMLEEKVSATYTDDLQENAIEVVDGGDGLINGNDYILFFGTEPGKWELQNNRFTFIKNLYSDTTYYFLTVQGNNGKRINTDNIAGLATINIVNYTYRYHYELDSLNFLNSGKQWFGEEFSTFSGNSTTRNFAVPLPNNTLTTVSLTSSVLARSINGASSFNVQVNAQNIQSITVPSISGGFLDVFANVAQQQNAFVSNQSTLNLQYAFNRANSNAQGWLNWFTLQCQLPLQMGSNGILFFRDVPSVGNNIVAFNITNTNASTIIWDISNPINVRKINTSFSNNQTNFIQSANILKEYVAFNANNALTPFFCEYVNYQNIHNSIATDYLIITHPNFLTAANNLATFHRNNYKYKVTVVNTHHIYNEFSAGIPDVSAVRDCIKMYYDKGLLNGNPLQYVCLFGAASFDYKKRIPNNTNFVPAYETDNSLNPLATHTSDDFFGLLKIDDDINNIITAPLLQIGIGRIPCKNINEANTVVTKIINYHQPKTFGAWKNETVFIADDGDNNIHLADAELMSSTTQTADSVFNANKIYLDAFPLVSSSSGGRYPAVNNAIVNKFFTGALLVNYTGHGGFQRLADEAIFTFDELQALNNANKLPLMVTATCDFVPFDDPTKKALGSHMLLASANGAIALTTTTRLVFAFSNRIMNNNYLKIAMQPNANQQYLTLGDAIKNAKNFTYQTFADIFNNRKFTLIGDPAMRLAFPSLQIKNTAFTNANNQVVDTLSAGQLYTAKGTVNSNVNTIDRNFNGIIEATIYGNPTITSTLANNIGSIATQFNELKNIVFKGKATVTNGEYRFSFIMPKDIGFVPEKGRLSVYASNTTTDAAGVNTKFIIGGNTTLNVSDNTPPNMKLFLNDTLFKNGGVTHQSPILLVYLFDENGINVLGNTIGHELLLTIDGDTKNSIVLNNFFSNELDSYQKGQLNYQLNNLSIGKHFLTVKAWDNYNNAVEKRLDFEVINNLQNSFIGKVLVFPNPITNTGATFSFEHNLPNQNLHITLTIMEMNGKLVYQKEQTLNTAGTRNCQIFWNGITSSSNFLQNGVYLYRIIVQTSTGMQQLLTGKFIKN